MQRPISEELQSVIATYRRRALRYDAIANLYYLIGFRDRAYRRTAVQALNLHRGDTVVEIGCGTGLNFGLLLDAIGPEGKLIGVDVTDAMLAQAEQRVARQGWSNIELVLSDATSFQFPTSVSGILSTFALSLTPACADIVVRGSNALALGGRWVILDFRTPPRLPVWVARMLLLLVKPFAITEVVEQRKPWDAIKRAMEATLANVVCDEFYFGFVYLLVGEKARLAGGAE